MKACIVIPAYNEERTIQQVVNESKKYGEVVVVEDTEAGRWGGAAVAQQKGVTNGEAWVARAAPPSHLMVWVAMVGVAVTPTPS